MTTIDLTGSNAQQTSQIGGLPIDPKDFPAGPAPDLRPYDPDAYATELEAALKALIGAMRWMSGGRTLDDLVARPWKDFKGNDVDSTSFREAIALVQATLGEANDVPPLTVPEPVRYALDRMCMPLHESRLSGFTALEDARCMQVIRAYILGEGK